MTKRLRRLLFLAAFVAVAVFASPGRAESHDPRCLAFGWLTEHADAVVIAVAAEERADAETGAWELQVTIEESIRGPLRASARATVAGCTPGGKPYVMARRHLAFLRALPQREGEPVRYEPISGAFGIREIPEVGPEIRFPAVCREIAGFLDDTGAVRDEGAYRAKLVRWIEDADPGLAWSAATDLVRHAEMHAALTPAEKLRVVAAFDRQPIANDAKKALALAAAATRDATAGAALVRSLILPNAWTIRMEVGEALRRLEDPAATTLLLAALKDAEPAHRVDLLNVLGTVAPASAEAATAVRGCLADPLAVVRIEAAHTLGLIARSMHRAEPPLPFVGRAELVQMAETAAGANEQIASTWALAQFDEPEAYAALRHLAADDPRELVRKSAERYLANPRLSMILR